MDVKKMVSFCIDSFFYKGKKRGRHVPPLSSNNAFRMTKTKNDTHAYVGILQRTVTVQFVEQRVQQKNSLFSLLRDDASSLLLDVVVEVPMSIFFPPVCCCDSFLTMMMIRTRRSDVRDDDIRGVRKRRATRATTSTQRGRRGMHTTTPRGAWGHFGTQMICVPFLWRKNNTETFLIITKGKRREREQQRKNHRR